MLWIYYQSGNSVDHWLDGCQTGGRVAMVIQMRTVQEGWKWKDGFGYWLEYEVGEASSILKEVQEQLDFFT